MNSSQNPNIRRRPGLLSLPAELIVGLIKDYICTAHHSERDPSLRNLMHTSRNLRSLLLPHVIHTLDLMRFRSRSRLTSHLSKFTAAFSARTDLIRTVVIGGWWQLRCTGGILPQISHTMRAFVLRSVKPEEEIENPADEDVREEDEEKAVLEGWERGLVERVEVVVDASREAARTIFEGVERILRNGRVRILHVATPNVFFDSSVMREILGNALVEDQDCGKCPASVLEKVIWDADMVTLAILLRRAESLVDLRMSVVTVTDTYHGTPAEVSPFSALRVNHKIRLRKFKAWHLGAKNLGQLGAALVDASAFEDLKELIVRDDASEGDVVILLAEGIKRLNKLTKLVWVQEPDYWKIDKFGVGALALADAIKNHEFLRSVQLETPYFDDHSLEAMGKALGSCRGLEVVDMYDSHWERISVPGFVKYLRALVGGPGRILDRLVELDLNFVVGKEGWEEIKEVIKEGKVLRSVDMSFSPVPDTVDGIDVLMRMKRKGEDGAVPVRRFHLRCIELVEESTERTSKPILSREAPGS
ncbi:hypothetical protein BJ742DRAFT_812331 [Cladochytrium replicatum]|nr:hypothetical protein BJ742DRAFT_812331 [Cladochytrium replicatum]